MLHTMNLYKEPFNAIKSGNKTVEVRLNDEKRRKISKGDHITFKKLSDGDGTLTVEVQELKVYDTFRQMYEDIPADKLGAKGSSIDEMVSNTYDIYTSEQEQKWGTLAIFVTAVN